MNEMARLGCTCLAAAAVLGAAGDLRADEKGDEIFEMMDQGLTSASPRVIQSVISLGRWGPGN